MVNRCLDANLRYLAHLVVAADNADAAMPRRSVQVQLKRNKARPEFQLREAASGSASKCGVQAAVERRGGAPPETAAIGLESSVRTP